MGDSKPIAEKIRRLRNERRNLMHEIEEVKKLADSEATAFESAVNMLREDLSVLKMDLPPNEPKEKADPKKKPREHFFRHFFR